MLISKTHIGFPRLSCLSSVFLLSPPISILLPPQLLLTSVCTQLLFSFLRDCSFQAPLPSAARASCLVSPLPLQVKLDSVCLYPFFLTISLPPVVSRSNFYNCITASMGYSVLWNLSLTFPCSGEVGFGERGAAHGNTAGHSCFLSLRSWKRLLLFSHRVTVYLGDFVPL